MSLNKTIPATLFVLAAALPGVAPAQPETAWDDYVRRQPDAVDDDRIDTLMRKILSVLTPEQGEAFLAGADPAGIYLESGESLAEFMATALSVGPGLVYVPVDSCIIFRTAFSVDGRMMADETREFSASPEAVDLSAQGGSATGCGIPAVAEAMVLSIRLVAVASAGGAGSLKLWTSEDPEPSTMILDYEPVVEPPMVARRRFSAVAVVELCPAGTCASGEFMVKTADLGAHVRGDVAGYFRPVETADLPGGPGSGVDADTLDGLDSSDFALAVHTHDGSDIVSGTVDETFIDPDVARDAEVVPIVLVNDGSGSTLDGDLLDGKNSLDLMLQVDSCLTVSPSCPAAAADALAARCWRTISAALAEIGVGLPAASAANRYLVKVGPGTYSEQVTMLSFVDIEGAGQKLTKITQPGFAVANGTVRGANDAELRHLRVENSGGGDFTVGIYNADVSPSLKHVTAYATVGTTVSAAIFNDGTGLANPTLTHVTAFSSGDAVLNEDAAVTVRDSVLGDPTMGVNGINNTSTGVGSSANVVNTNLNKPATDPMAGVTFTCLGAYDATFVELDANCQ